jgi:hypothetical protein
MLEKKKLKSELMRVIAAKYEMDYLIEQKMEEVGRLKAAMEKQVMAEKDIETRLNALEGV